MQQRSDSLPVDAIEQICRKYRVSELSVFGSSGREHFRDDSDVDLLVEYLPDAHPTLITLSKMRRELAQAIGRSVDLVPKGGLKPIVRDDVLNDAEIVYGHHVG